MESGHIVHAGKNRINFSDKIRLTLFLEIVF